MDLAISNGLINLLQKLASMYRSFTGKHAKEQKSVFDSVYRDLTEKLSISTDFGDILVDFKLAQDWQRLKEHSLGDIRFRDFYSKDNITSAHNFWTEDSIIFNHTHSNADEYIYLVHGLLEVTMGENKVRIHPDADNPYIIKCGILHSLKAVETSVFVTKFVIKKN